MKSKHRKLKPGEMVVLTELPPGPINAEFQFVDADGAIHFIYVDPKFIRSTH